MEAIHDWAHRYIDRGFAPIPVQFKGKACSINEWQKLKLAHQDVPGIFCDLPCNIGIVLGQLSGGLVDIDLDCVEAITLARYMLPATGMVFGRESKPQSHWIYKAKGIDHSLKLADLDGRMLVEVRADRHMTVFPGSVHQSGEEIGFDQDGEPVEIEFSQLVLSAKHLAAASVLLPHWHEGQRHNLALAVAGTLLNGGISPENAARFIEALIRATHDEEQEDRNGCLETTVRALAAARPVSGRKALAGIIGEGPTKLFCEWLGLTGSKLDRVPGKGTPATFGGPVPQSDVANAERFAAHHSERATYCPQLKRWLVWDGSRWAPDDGGQIMRLAIVTGREIAFEAAETGHKENLYWAAKVNDLPRLRNMVTLAQSHCETRLDAFDADPWRLNCRSGIVDLRTGELLQPDPAALMRRLAPTSFDPNARCPVFFGFLDRIFDGDAELIAFLQRGIGYSLTGKTHEQVLFVLVGNGANGKSTLIHVIQELLGDYAQTTPMDTLMTRRSAGVPNDIARLEGARFVSAAEAEAGQCLAEAKIKQLTGGDRISARFLNAEFFEFVPQFKLWVATNKLPEVKGTDEGIWRRFRVIPFNVTIPERERDPTLPEKLKHELPGILNWAVAGCLQWQTRGLRPPAKVVDATKAYRADMDLVAQFVSDWCVVDRTAEETVNELYVRYCSWCEENGEQTLTKRAFGLRLQQLGFEEARSGMARKRRGIRLKLEREFLEEELAFEPEIFEADFVCEAVDANSDAAS